MKDIISDSQVSNFLNTVKKKFPNFIAGVISDNHGFPIASKVPKNFPYKENILALEAVAEKRSFIDKSKYVKVKRNLNNENSIKLLLILDKPNTYIHSYKDLKHIIKKQALF